MELKEAIDKLFEMTDEQRYELFEYTNAEDILDSYLMSSILQRVEDFYSKPKYGDVYLDKNGKKVIVLSGGFTLCENYECSQAMSAEYIDEFFTKTGKNVTDKLKGLFE